MMLFGLGIAGIAIMVATGIGFWNMFTLEEIHNDEEIPTNEKISIDEPLTKPDDKDEGDLSHDEIAFLVTLKLTENDKYLNYIFPIW